MKAYFVQFDEYEGTGIAFVANTSKEAKMMAWKHWDYDGRYIDLRPRWLKKANTDGLPPGEIAGSIESVKRGFYSWIEDKCPRCGRETMLSLSENHNEVMCSFCEEMAYQNELDGADA